MGSLEPACYFMNKKILQTAQKQNYVVVNQKEDDNATDNKEGGDVKVTRAPTLFANRKGGVGKGKGKLSLIKTRIAWSASLTSSSNTALTTVAPIDPSLSSEWTNFQALFDECKITGGSMHYHLSTAGGAPTDIDFAIAYDPTNGGVYTGIVGVLVADQFQLKRVNNAQTTTVVGPQTFTESGFWTFKFKCPNAPQKIASNAAVDQEVCTGLWADTTNSVSPKYGYVKPYIAAAGTSIVTSLSCYFVVDIMFRSRS